MTSDNQGFTVETRVFSCKVETIRLYNMIQEINRFLEDKNGVNIQYHNIGNDFVIATVTALIPPGK